MSQYLCCATGFWPPSLPSTLAPFGALQLDLIAKTTFFTLFPKPLGWCKHDRVHDSRSHGARLVMRLQGETNVARVLRREFLLWSTFEYYEEYACAEDGVKGALEPKFMIRICLSGDWTKVQTEVN